MRVFQTEALALEPGALDAVRRAAHGSWADARACARAQTRRQRFRGEAGAWTLPRVSVSRLERYLDCPFRFFASEVLRLEEQPEDEDTRTPLERGRFLHELFERFFSEWQRRGHRRIDSGVVAGSAANSLLSCARRRSPRLSPAEATLERARLLGSAVSPGIAHRVFAMEAERAVDVVERLLEFPLQGDFRFRGARWARAHRHAERQDRSHRSARRRHDAGDRLQVEEDAGPEGRPAVADLQSLRAALRSRTPRSALDAGRGDLSVVRRRQGGGAVQSQEARTMDGADCRRAGSAAGDTRRHCRGTFSTAPAEEVDVRSVSVRQRSAVSSTSKAAA